MKTIMVIGADTPLGWSVYNFLAREGDYNILLIMSQEDDVFGMVNNRIVVSDIYNKKLIKKTIFQYNPDVIINCVFDINRYEVYNKKQDFWHNNYSFVENIIRAGMVSEAHIITFSSELVFDGNNGPYNEDDKQIPCGFIGKSMLAIENFEKSLYHKMTIFRLSDYYGFTPFGFNFYLDNIFSKKLIDVELNYYTNPVYLDDIAIACMKVIEQNNYGIFNLGGSDYVSKAEFIMSVVRNNYIFEKKYMHEVRDSLVKKYGLVNLKATTVLGISFASIYDGATSMRYALSAGDRNRFSIL